jgi:Heterokaryon incompatibility protein (HET)
MANYAHQVLKDPSSEIRLVNLQPGFYDDPININITHTSLVHSPYIELGDTPSDTVGGSVFYRSAADGSFLPRRRVIHPPRYRYEYEALSYAWGDPTITTPVTIHGLPFEVTTNLESALRHLRSERNTRTLWIDAICIQQLNHQERDEQIRIMGLIYATALKVVIWLGPEADDSCHALEAMGGGFIAFDSSKLPIRKINSG